MLAISAISISACSCQCWSAGVNLALGRGLDLCTATVDISRLRETNRRCRIEFGGLHAAPSAGAAPSRPMSLLAQSAWPFVILAQESECLTVSRVGPNVATLAVWGFPFFPSPAHIMLNAHGRSIARCTKVETSLRVSDPWDCA